MMETWNLEQAAMFLKLHPEELRRRAKAGAVPAAKVGKCWVFMPEDLEVYVRSLYADHWQALRVRLGKETDPCHSLNAVMPGGSISSPPTGNEYDVLLGLGKKTSRKNIMTG
jgi:hypothetical protein